MFDSVWFWAISSIASALLGASALAYLKDTKIGLWGYKKFDSTIDAVRDKYNISALDQPDDAWRVKNPQISAKLDDLESRLAILEKK